MSSALFQPFASCVFCHLLCGARSGPADLGSESTHRGPGGLQHFPVHLLLYTAEEDQHRQYLGWSRGWSHPSCHGLDGRNWKP